MKPVLLIIDDEPQIRKILKISLEGSYKIVEAADGAEGILKAATNQPSLILLDLGLPDKDGLEVLKELREWSSIPVIILSVRKGVDDIVTALDYGADDYITKPFSSAELMARIRANMRKILELPESIYINGPLSVDFARRTVMLNGAEVKLTNIEYSLLVLFIKNAGKALTHRFILKEIWGPGYVEQTQNLRVFVAQLRKKIETEDNKTRMIQTESGIGYRFVNHK